MKTGSFQMVLEYLFLDHSSRYIYATSQVGIPTYKDWFSLPLSSFQLQSEPGPHHVDLFLY